MERTARDPVDDAPSVDRNGDRRVGRRYVFRDRRSGFDRRHDPTAGLWTRTLLRLQRSPHLLEILLVLLVALNLADLVFTQIALGAGATETNPVMAALFDESFVSAAALKILISLMIVFIVLAFRRYRKMMALAVFGTVLYTGVFVYHLATTPLF